MRSVLDRETIEARILALRPWFHNIPLGDGITTKDLNDPTNIFSDQDVPAPLWRAIEEFIPRNLMGTRALDVGCNAGFFAFKLWERGAAVVGIDSDQGATVSFIEQAKFCNEMLGANVEFRRQKLVEAPDDDRYDLILFLGVLYHVPDFCDALAKLHRLCTPNGLVAVETQVSPRTLTCYERGFRGDPTTYFVPSPAILRSLLGEYDFEIVQERAIGAERHFCLCAPRESRATPALASSPERSRVRAGDHHAGGGVGASMPDLFRALVRRVVPASARHKLRSLLKKRLEGGDRQGVARRLQGLDVRIERLEEQIFARPYVNPEFIRAQAMTGTGDAFDYYGFEQKFRGPYEVIRDKLRFYLPYLEGRTAIVDIGCGRGEFLEVLREKSMRAVGVEIDGDQVAECHRKGLNVVQSDLFDYLRSLPNESVDAIFSARVIERIAFRELVALFKLSFNKLKTGGILVAETVNPHCTAAFKLFWLDPTHVTPLYPEVLQFLAESSGFTKVEIVYPGAVGEGSLLYHESGEYAIIAAK